MDDYALEVIYKSAKTIGLNHITVGCLLQGGERENTLKTPQRGMRQHIDTSTVGRKMPFKERGKEEKHFVALVNGNKEFLFSRVITLSSNKSLTKSS